jgi:hypothetical protein
MKSLRDRSVIVPLAPPSLPIVHSLDYAPQLYGSSPAPHGQAHACEPQFQHLVPFAGAARLPEAELAVEREQCLNPDLWRLRSRLSRRT